MYHQYQIHVDQLFSCDNPSNWNTARCSRGARFRVNLSLKHTIQYAIWPTSHPPGCSSVNSSVQLGPTLSALHALTKHTAAAPNDTCKAENHPTKSQTSHQSLRVTTDAYYADRADFVRGCDRANIVRGRDWCRGCLSVVLFFEL